MYELTIDEEIEHLLPPLSDEEFTNLENDIVANGVREAIIVWAGHGIIADGHNRYHICKKHGIPYAIFEKEFADRSELADWAVKNQKTRRNLTKGQEADIAIRLYAVKYAEEAKATKDKAGQKNLEKYNAMRSITSADQLVGTSVADTPSAPESQHTTPQPESDDIEVAVVHEATEQHKGVRREQVQNADSSSGVAHTSNKKKSVKDRNAETARRIAKDSGVGEGTIKRVMAVHKSGEQDLIDGIQSGNMSANGAYKEMRRRQVEPTTDPEPGCATIYARAYANETTLCDLLITEAPDSTEWMYTALSGVRQTGFAYVFVNPEPSVLNAYLNADVPPNVELVQVLVWSFDYILNNNDRSRYKPSWKAILFFRGIEAHELRFQHLKERNAVHVVNASGGNLGDREYDLRMPMELARRLIGQSTREGDLVFDPFAKQGTFLTSARKLGRDGIGYEDDETLSEEAFANGVSRG